MYYAFFGAVVVSEESTQRAGTVRNEGHGMEQKPVTRHFVQQCPREGTTIPSATKHGTSLMHRVSLMFVCRFYIRNLCAQSFICHIFLLSLVLAFLLRSQRCRIIIIPLWFIIDCPLGTWWYVVCCGLATASQGIRNGCAVTQ